MPFITFIDHLENEQVVDAKVGQSVMQAAVDNLVDGIVAECGGSCACATCHCFIDQEWQAKMPEISEIERDTLECATEVTPTSRLSCQVTVTEELDGLVVRLPEDQL